MVTHMAPQHTIGHVAESSSVPHSDAPRPGWTIGELARRAGVRPSAIRYYESIGILLPTGRINGRRRYDPVTLHRLHVLQLAQAAGLTIREIRTLFDGFAPETSPSARWRALAAPKLAELDALIARAHAMKSVLGHMLACACPSLDVCGAAACE